MDLRALLCNFLPQYYRVITAYFDRKDTVIIIVWQLPCYCLAIAVQSFGNCRATVWQLPNIRLPIAKR